MKYQIFTIYFLLIKTALMTNALFILLLSYCQIVFTYLATVSNFNE